MWRRLEGRRISQALDPSGKLTGHKPRKKVPALGGYDLKWTGTIFILGRDNIRTKVWGKFHKNWTKNTHAQMNSLYPLKENCQGQTRTIFELGQDIISTKYNVLSKIQDLTKNITS
ncbi:hypothetical protein DPMN_016540 [Dreissena polymorpha]|uniref:Uncharacterized protein n=1 Tax=Dreissena polymorpha TaxID=45954 RepID=A0A9D4NFU2_DREPO|nr:hypothetical protein DPMN_016540 [Dreissena polymorpha]